MNFKDLLARYKDGTVTVEEKEIVEKELEKYASIEDYYAEQLPEDFLEKEERVEEDALTNADETKDIKKLVNRRLAKVVFISVFIVVLLYIVIVYGISAVVDQFYYDPTAVSESENQDYPTPDFDFDMTAYVSLNMPGYVINSTTTQNPQGFGTYDLSYSLKNLFTNNEQRHFLELERGRFTYAIDGIYGTENRFNIWQGFEDIEYPKPVDREEEFAESQKEIDQLENDITLDYLNNLNPLSYISMTIIFEEDMTMQGLYDINNEYSELDIKWVGVRTTDAGTEWDENRAMHLIGFNPNPGDESSSNRMPDPEKYPLFYLNDAWGDSFNPFLDFPEAYETHFKSRLNYIRNQEEFVETVNYSTDKIDFYEDALAYIEGNGVETYGVRVYGTAEAFSQSIDEIPYESLYINEVSSAKPNIYYD